MLRIKICTVGRNWCYLSDGIAVIPKQISVKKLKFLHNNKDIDKGDKGGNFFFLGGGIFFSTRVATLFNTASVLFICRSSDSTMSENAGIEPRTVRLWH